MEQAFALTYCIKSIGYEAIEKMTRKEREFFLKRLNKQLKKENDEIEKIKRKAKTK